MVFNKNQFGLDRKTVEAFTEGDCWRLAFDLHKKLGHPVFVMTPEADTKGDRDSLFFNHMFVKNPTNGKFLDINGEHSEEELFEAGWAGDCEKPTIFEVSDNLKIGQASPPVIQKT